MSSLIREDRGLLPGEPYCFVLSSAGLLAVGAAQSPCCPALLISWTMKPGRPTVPGAGIVTAALRVPALAGVSEVADVVGVPSRALTVCGWAGYPETSHHPLSLPPSPLEQRVSGGLGC